MTERYTKNSFTLRRYSSTEDEIGLVYVHNEEIYLFVAYSCFRSHNLY